MSLFLIFSVILIGLMEGVPLIKKGMWKELITVSSLLAIAMFLQISKNLWMITPTSLIQRLLEPIGKILFNQ